MMNTKATSLIFVLVCILYTDGNKITKCDKVKGNRNCTTDLQTFSDAAFTSQKKCSSYFEEKGKVKSSESYLAQLKMQTLSNDKIIISYGLTQYDPLSKKQYLFLVDQVIRIVDMETCEYRETAIPLNLTIPEIKDSKIVKSIDKGAFGKVFLGYKRTNPDQMYAIKAMKKNKMIRRAMASQVATERNAEEIVRSIFCVQLFGSSQSISHVYSVMEYMVGRDYDNLLSVYSYISALISNFYIDQEMSVAFEYLHYRHGVIFLHKGRLQFDLVNMLLSKDDRLKLADFCLENTTPDECDVKISDLRLEQIRRWNNFPYIHCEFTDFTGYQSISRSSKDYRTELLFKAIKRRKKSLAKQLLKSGVSVNALTPCCAKHAVMNCFHSLLMVNAIYGNSDITRMLIRAGCNLNTATTHGITALHFALQWNKRGIAAELIQSGANVHLQTKSTDSTALHLAIVRSSHIDSTMEILQNKWCLYHSMEYAWNYLCSILQVRIGKLSARIYDLRKKRRACLYLVKMLLDSGADVNYKDYYGCSAIHYAAFTGNLELMKILIRAGADIDSQNSIGATALHNAVLFDDEEMVLLLLNSGLNITIKTQQGDSALHWASSLIEGDSCSDFSVLKKLLDHGGEVNENNANNETIMNLSWYPSSIIMYVAEVEARTQNKVLDDHNLAIMNECEHSKSLYEKLQAELAAMRNNKIENTEISYLSVLTEPLEEVAVWVRNKEFVKNFEASDYQTAYPMYAPRLTEKMVAATRRTRKSVKWSKEVEFSCCI